MVNARTLWQFLIIGVMGLPLQAQITLIPDSAFENFLVVAGIDTDGEINGQVLTADIADETSLGILCFGIQDMTGIQDFEALEVLDLWKMDISNLDLSQNTNLRRLSLDDLSLDSLDLTQNTNLVELILSLSSPSDTYPGNISEIDLSQNVLLEEVSIGDSFIVIDLSNSPNLRNVNLGDSETLTHVNLNNGNNGNISFLRIEDVPNLQCVQVDDPAAVMAGTDPPYDNWIIENDPLITDDCELGVAGFLGKNIGLYPNPVRSELSLEVSQGISIKEISIYNVQGSQVLKKEGTSSLGVSSLSPGVYFMSIQTDKGMATKKFVKL
ncbi:MAG: hypothetical protein Aureis2KO_02760 [Aureisphaera sp.]